MRSNFLLLTATLLFLFGQSIAVAESRMDKTEAAAQAATARANNEANNEVNITATATIDVPIEVASEAADAATSEAADVTTTAASQLDVVTDAVKPTALTAVEVQAVTTQELDAPTKAAVAELESYLEKTASMTAGFESVLLNPQGEPSGERSTGKLILKRPGRFRWEYESPYPSLMLADGVNLWTYDEDLDEAIVRQLADYEAASPMLLLSGEVTVNDSFQVLGSHIVEGAQWLVLAPLEKDADFVQVRIKLDNEKIELMELVDKLDATSRIVFSDVAINPDVDDSLFNFVLPEGVNLVGQPAPVSTAGSAVSPATTE